MTADITQIGKMVEEKSSFIRLLINELEKVIVGQQYMLERILVAMLSNGHILLEGVPGLAKTTAVTVLARAIKADFHRIQFTPDLLPADLTGTQIYRQSDGQFYTRKGPIFANIILADEINRAPAKVQSALLEAMQERQVTIGDQSFPIPEPFLVLATQNPIEQEGTYPLPEAQLDRFMFNIRVDYPSEAEEFEIVDKTTSTELDVPDQILSGSDIVDIQKLIKKVPVSEDVLRFSVRLARASRDENMSQVGQYLSWGAGPRAGQYLILGAKTRAIMLGRTTPDIEDVQAVAYPVFRHRLVTNFHAEADGITTDDLIGRLLEAV